MRASNIIIIGNAHFIKTVVDLYQVMIGTSSQLKFGIVFC
ncbi:adenosine-specific kinase [Moorena sp. SIO4G3]